jgi:hypothetical protein
MDRVDFLRTAAEAIDDICRSALITREDVLKALHCENVREEIIAAAKAFRDNPPRLDTSMGRI